MLKFGTSNIGKVFAGTSAVAGVYSGNNLIWSSAVPETVFNVSKMTSDVYEGSTTYSNCKFIAFKVRAKSGTTGEVTYGGITKTITGTSETNVIFGQYGSGADDGTADSGNITFKNIWSIAGYSFNSTKSATSYFSGLNSVVEWGGLTTLGSHLFYQSPITNLVIGGNVTTIYGSTFYYATNLQSLTLSSKVATISMSASSASEIPFYYCNNLSITVDANNPNFSSQNGILYDKNKTSIYFIPTSLITSSYTVPSGVTKLESGVFSHSSYTSINLNNVTSIGSYVFYNHLTDFTITNFNNLTYIGTYACQGSTGLKTIVLSPNLTYIGTGAFNGCTALTSITFNGYQGTQTFGAYANAFGSTGMSAVGSGCAVTCNANIPNYFFAGSSTTGTLKISNLILNNVTSIGDYAFNYVKFLATNMTIGDSALTHIGESAFRNGTVTNTSAAAATNYIMTIGPIMSLGDYAFETFHTGTVKFTTEDEPPATDDYTTIFGAISSLGANFEILVPDQFYDQYYYTWEDFQSYITAYV